MLFVQRRFANISLILVLCLLLAPFVDAAELSLLDKLKLKTNEKVEQVQQRDWWITKAAGKATGFVAGKAGGAIGAAIGYVLGAAVGGPVAAGIGGMVGFRIGDIVTKTFAKAVGEVVAQRKLKEGGKVDLEMVVDAIKSVNKASLSAEAVGAVFGDLVGGSLGAAVGIALLAGATPFAIPLIGTISAAYLGSKLGKAIGRGIGRWIGRKTLVKGYEAYAASDRSRSAANQEEDNIEAGLTEIKDPTPDNTEADLTLNSPLSYNPAADYSSTQDARLAYEKAYREYTEAVTSPAANDVTTKLKLQAYRNAYEAYRAAVSVAGSGQ